MKKKILIIINVDWFYISHFKKLGERIISSGYELHLATEFTGNYQILRKQGIVLHKINLSRSSSSLISEIRTFVSILKIILKVNPSIIQLFTIKAVIYGGLCARIIGFKNLIPYITGLGYLFTDGSNLSKVKFWLLKQFYKLSIDINGINLICENKYDLNFLKKIIIGKSANMLNYHLIPGAGVNLEEFKYLPLPKGLPIVVLPARMLWQKGVQEFVDAARILRSQKVKARFCLVGCPDPDNPASISEAKINEWKKENVVEIWGHRNDMPLVMSTASIIVLPSYREGMPKTLLEASASGRAIVTTDVPGCRDAVVKNKTGLIVPVRNAIDLAKSIKNLIDNPKLLNSMGASGRSHAEKYFSILHTTSINIKLFENVLYKEKVFKDKIKI